MTSYYPHGVKLRENQKAKLAKAVKNNSAITIRLSKNELAGSDQLMLTKTQLKRIQKSMKNGTGTDVKISKTQIRKAVQEGGSLRSSLFSLRTKMLPFATKAVSKAVPALATGALSGLANIGIDKIFGKGQVGGFLIPENKINQLIQYKDWLTDAQKKKIVSALHSGGQVVIKPTKAQSGGFLGTLLASIGVPLLLNALTGKGLHVDKKRPKRSLPVFVPNPIPVKKKDGGLVLPVDYRPPPFFGSGKSNRYGSKKKKLPKKEKDFYWAKTVHSVAFPY